MAVSIGVEHILDFDGDFERESGVVIGLVVV